MSTLTRRSDISLGDLLSACRELEADEATASAIARLLKLTAFAGPEAAPAPAADPWAGLAAPEPGGDAREDARRGPPEAAATPADEAVPVVEEVTEPAPAPEPEPEEVPPAEASGPVVPSWLRRVADRGAGVSQAGAEASQLPKPDGRAEAAPAFEPLLFPVWTRAILSGALSSRTDDGPLDLKRVVEQIARGEASARLPRRPRPTLARGVQVLVDRGETMLLFAEDQRWLEAEIQKVVGPGRAPVLYFEGCPTRRAGRGSWSRWKPYLEHHLPRSGTVLLLLTDLGAGHPASVAAPAGADEWLDFAGRLRRHGCPLVAFVPYAPARYPDALHRLVTIIQWDRTTSASSVHSRVGKGHAT